MVRSPFKTPERLTNLQNEITGLVEKLWRFGTSAIVPEGVEFAPVVEVTEQAECFIVLAELPGVPAASVEVAATPSGLTISGEKPRPTGTTTDIVGAEYPRVVQSERRYGRFSRTIALPSPIQVDAVAATARDGVLEIQLPKAAGPKPVQVRVEVR